ncbi:MAG: amidohydrolase [Burkholderiales bacterium]|nr:amidohydrolase [Burkholderiales bacterium]
MPDTADIMIRGATILTVDPERRVITDGAIVIEKDRIKDIGKNQAIAPAYQARKTIDGRGMLVMPGIVNLHFHAYHGVHRGVTPEDLTGECWSRWVHGKVMKHVTAESEVPATVAGLIETVKSGTTTVLESGSFATDEVIEGVAPVGARAFMGRRVHDQAVMGHTALIRNTDECLKLNEQLLIKYRDGLAGGRVRPHVCIAGNGKCSDTLLTESKKMADSYGAVLNMHQAGRLEQVFDQLDRTGMRPIEHLESLGFLGPNVNLVHMIQVNDREIEMLRRHRVNVIHCPATALKLAMGLATFGRFPEMLNRGVNVGLGTDAVDCASYHDMIRVMYLAAVIYKDHRFDANVMGAETAIEMATINGARALGMEKEIGSLEKGKKADVILIDMRSADWIPVHNPIQNLVYSASGSSVHTAIVDGRIIMEDREMKTVDEEKILAECQRTSEELIRKCGVNPIHTLRWKVV